MKFLPALALVAAAMPAFADYSTHPRAQQLIEELEGEVGYTRAELTRILQSAQKVPKLIEAEQKAPEKTKTWPEYRAIFMRDWRIEGGAEFMRTHAAALERAEREYGVPGAVITAIIGVETRYGGYTGPHRVLDSLATQGFDHPTRWKFFYGEFKEFLLACREFSMDPLAVKGSYAGAMGLSQFMPSNYRKLAVDFDNNGHTDLWTVEDAIGSTANYLANYRGAGRGWQPGEAVVTPASARSKVLDALDVNTRWAPYTAAQLSDAGIPLARRLPAATELGVVVLQTERGDHVWLAHENFYNIMAYNPRTFYAMAVYDLSQAIARAAAR